MISAAARRMRQSRPASAAPHYEIDLNSKHAQELRGQLERYVKAARKVTRSAAQPARVRRINANDARNKEIRNWAKERGLEINDRGRIPADIVAQYETENGKQITASAGPAPATLSIHPPDGRLHRDRNTPGACRPCLAYPGTRGRHAVRDEALPAGITNRDGALSPESGHG